MLKTEQLIEDKKILAVKQYTKQENGKHMQVILCHCDEGYIVFLYDSLSQEFHSGHYCSDMDEGIKQFNKRGQL